MSDDPRERTVLDGLAELREAMSELEATAWIKPSVMSAFRSTRRGRWNRTRLAPFYWWAAATATCAVLVAVAAYWLASPKTRNPPLVAVSPPARVSRPPVEKEPANAADVRAARAPSPAPGRQTGRRRPAVAARDTAARPEFATDFFPLPYAPPLEPGDGGQIVRVRLPRSAMRTVGLPVNDDDRWFDRVPADVVLGQDGVARAVRFVKFAQ
jgi:hypothetical protein